MKVDWIALFLRLDGRIGRKAFWLGAPVAGLVLALAWVALHALPWPLYALSFVIAAYPLLAVVIKRLHDRGRSGLFAVGFLAIPVALAFGGAIVFRIAGRGHAAIQDASTIGFQVGLVVLVLALVLELGLRPGASGYSKHGPPPLA